MVAVAQQQLRQNRERTRHNNEPVYRSPTEVHSIDSLQRRMYELKSDVEQEDKELEELLQKTRARRYRTICMAVTVIVLLVVAIGIVAGVTVNGRNGHDTTQNGSTSEEEDLANRPSLLEIQNCTSLASSSSIRSERYENFYSLVSSDLVIASAIATPYSSLSIALCWISQYDEYAMDPTTLELVPEIVERFALASIFYHFAATNETMLYPNQGLSQQNWLSNSHVCEWDFVECASFDGLNLVTTLSFQMDTLVGQIPYELGLLPNLVRLDIAPSSMSGAIPSSFWTLTHLEHVSLRFNEFGGTIVNGFVNLKELKYLYFEHRLSGALPDTTNLSKLTYLQLMNDWRGGPDPFPDLTSATDLEVFDAFVPLRGDFPPYFWNLTKLTFLLAVIEYGAVNSGIGRLTNLEHVQLQLALNDSLHEDALPSELGRLTKLKSLELLSVGPCPSPVFVPPELCLLKQTGNLKDMFLRFDVEGDGCSR